MQHGSAHGNAHIRPHRHANFAAGFRMRGGGRADGARRTGRPGAHGRRGAGSGHQLLRYRTPVRQWRVREEPRPHIQGAQAEERHRRHQSSASVFRPVQYRGRRRRLARCQPRAAGHGAGRHPAPAQRHYEHRRRRGHCGAAGAGRRGAGARGPAAERQGALPGRDGDRRYGSAAPGDRRCAPSTARRWSTTCSTPPLLAPRR